MIFSTLFDEKRMSGSIVSRTAIDALILGGVGMAALVAIPLAPIAAAVALPFFGVKAAVQAVQLHQLKSKTLTNGTRAPFGRVSGQNYTLWDGKDRALELSKDQKRIQPVVERAGYFFHGNGAILSESAIYDKTQELVFGDTEIDNYPFSDKDLTWFENEMQRLGAEKQLYNTLKMVRALAKALIPLIGLVWILCTETLIGGASQIECTVCRLGGTAGSHWSQEMAIAHHKAIITKKTEDLHKLWNYSLS